MSKRDTKYLLDNLDGIEGLDEFDVVASLASPDAIAAYINEVIASGNVDLMKEALKNVLQSAGVAHTAKLAGLTREGVYKALRPSSKPQFDTVNKLLDGLGLEIRVVPKAARDNSDALAA